MQEVGRKLADIAYSQIPQDGNIKSDVADAVSNAASQSGSSNSDDDVIDANYTVVDDDKKEE